MRTMQVVLALTMVAACGGTEGPVLHPKDAALGGDPNGSGGSLVGTGGAVVGAGGSVGTDGAVGGAPGFGGSSDAGASDGPFQCTYQGKLYSDGESVYLTDGCNVCVCKKEYGGMACTGAICGTGGATNTGGVPATGASGDVGTGGSFGTGGAAAAGGNSGTGGTGSSSDDGGADGVSGECGSPITKACYAACRESKDEATCSERGGTWQIKLSSTTEWTCVCPTGEGGRPCTASSDCLGHCSARKDPFGNGDWCKANVTSYTCTAEGGQPDCMCVPEEPFAVCFTW